MNIKRFLSGALCAVLLLALCPAAAADAPCEISSAEELSLLRETPDGDFVLTADIDMTGVDWQPIAFSGTLDGGGHTIYNLTVSSLGADRAETVDGNWSAADVSIWDDVAVASTVSTTDSSLHYTYITYNRDYIDLPPKYITTKTATPLKNKVLEWGIASPMTIRDDLLQWEQDASQNQGRMLPTVSIAIVTGASSGR